jgi:hypothetical protein
MPFKDPEVRRAHDRERYRKRAAERRAAGLCPKCGKRPPFPGRSLCTACAEKTRIAGRARDARLRAVGKPRRDREKARVADRRRYRRQVAERKALGLCAKCGTSPAEDGRRLCAECTGKRREAERLRYHQARSAGFLYGGKSVHRKRRTARIAGEKRRNARRSAGLCTACGRRPPVGGGATCRTCRERRRAAERAIYESRRSANACTRCGGPSADGAWQCIHCTALEIERGRPERRNAASRRRYWNRRAAGRCTDCNRPSHGASRCEACAKRSYERSQYFRGIPVWDPSFTVIELATGESHGPFDTEAEAAASLSFAGLGFDEVVILNDAPVTARFTGWT